MSNINNKNVNNQSSLNVDSINITNSAIFNTLNTNELTSKLIDSDTNINLNVPSSYKYKFNINNVEKLNIDTTGINLKNATGTTTLNINTTNNITSPNNIIVKSAGFTVKNNAGTSTFLDINNSGITTISSIHSQQLFNREMITNTSTYSSTRRGFAAGVKVINISFQHYATTAGQFYFKLYVRDMNDTNLQPVTTRRYTISTVNNHQMFSFHFVTDNIPTQSDGFYVTVSMIPVSTAVFASDSLYDSITGTIFNLANSTDN